MSKPRLTRYSSSTLDRKALAAAVSWYDSLAGAQTERELKREYQNIADQMNKLYLARYGVQAPDRALFESIKSEKKITVFEAAVLPKQKFNPKAYDNPTRKITK